MTKKAQVVLTDLFFATIIFLTLFVAFFITWTRLNARFDDFITFNELELLTIQISDLLTKSPGVPRNWETTPTNIQALGLASQDRVLAGAKINALSNLSYNMTRSLFNVDRFELYILIKQGNLAILELGNIPTKRAVHVQRLVRYEQQKATLDVALWKN